MKKLPITVAPGDGIGPEIMNATLELLAAAGAKLSVEIVEMGEQAYAHGYASGITPEAWRSLRKTGLCLKGPMTTPQGKRYKDVNLVLRKTLGIYASVRPFVSYHPFIPNQHPQMDIVIIRENEEDLYGGIEHRQTTDVYQCLKLISRPGCEKIIRYAFKYAQANCRKQVSAFTKDKLMEFTDSFFQQVFDAVAQDYPEIICQHQSLDIATARLADRPEAFDVIVIPNLYGDILSHVVARITTGSVALNSSVNFGNNCILFEAIHGHAPEIAHQDLANPSGLLLSAIMLLVHADQSQSAETLHNAWLSAIEDGQHTADIYTPGLSQAKLSCSEFTQAIIQRLGKKPQTLRAVHYLGEGLNQTALCTQHLPKQAKTLLGVDVFLDWKPDDAEVLAQHMRRLSGPKWELELITNLGVVVWPENFPETRCSDHWHCRFRGKSSPKAQDITALLRQIRQAGFDFIKTENLYLIDGEAAFTH